MNERARAISILQQAREVLARRLSERIVEAEREILDDAEGNCYLSEIESIYEQMGGRLAHISTMLSNLPPVEDPSTVDMAVEQPIYTDLTATYQTGSELESPLVLGPLALPAPATSDERPALSNGPTGLQRFTVQIQTGNVEAAAEVLSDLFEIDLLRARRCVEVFWQGVSMDPDMMFKVARLRKDLAAGSINGALLMLWECFGLQGVESLSVLRTLQARITAFQDDVEVRD